MESQIPLTTNLDLPQKCQVCRMHGDCSKWKTLEESRRKALIETCMAYKLS